MRKGAPLPDIRLEAAVSGRIVDNARIAGRRAVFVLHGPKNTQVPKTVARAVRDRWPAAEDVVLASIVDLRSFGGLWRRVAEAQIRATYQKLAAKAQEMGLDAEEHVLIIPDWEGVHARALAVADPAAKATAVVVDAKGKVAAVLDDGDIERGVLQALEP